MKGIKKVSKFLLKGVMSLFAALPLKVHYWSAKGFAWFIGSVVRYRRDDVMINLARSFPELKYKELKKICKQFYQHFADLLVEAVWFGGCSPERFRNQRIVELADVDSFNYLYENSTSVMLMTSHCGNWELHGGYIQSNYTGKPMAMREDNCCVVYKKLSSDVWNEIMGENRCATLTRKGKKDFHGYIESNDIIRYVLTHRDEKKFYLINTDQCPYKSAKTFSVVDFLNQKTATMTAAAALARKCHMSVAFLGMKNDRRGHYTLECHPICVDAARMDLDEIMKRYYALLEADIKAEPYNYLWTHRRWKKEIPHTED
jgi:Kdo2-lipid IVA lauroyltransferase/acyltransferase